MAKLSAKDATLLINGNKLSPNATAYEVTSTVEPVEATGFGEGSKNYIPGLATAKVSVDMLWNSDSVHDVLKTSGQTGNVTLLPEPYVAGCPSISLPFMQSNYTPQGSPDSILKIGSIGFESSGVNIGVEHGLALHQAAVTATTTGTAVDAGAATSGAYSAILHVWSKTTTDTYAVEIQDSSNGTTGWATVISFTLDGTAISSERITGTGAVKQYRRAKLTRTGTSGDSFGATVVLTTR